MHHEHSLDRVTYVRRKFFLHLRRIHSVAPVTRDHFDRQTKISSHFGPKAGKLACLKCQYAITRAKRVHQGGFPSSRRRRRIDDDWALGLEDQLQTRETIPAELAEFGAPVIDGRTFDRAENAVGNIGGSWYLKEVSADLMSHLKFVC